MKYSCAHCGKTAERPAGHVNRSRAQGLNLYCGRYCSGLARRKPHKPKVQRAEEKRLYDLEYRRKNLVLIKAKKRAYFRRTYDPALARVERRKRMAFHVKYCRQPSYRLWKREYDRRRRANVYGLFADAFELTLELNREIKSRSNSYDIRQANQTGNKTQKRKREAGYQKRRSYHSTPHSIQP